ncbi:hypothetical protein AVB38_23605 [Salmonella enterica subsp. enterica serovar Bredeney]|nr:hypothetical protein [Salmonella enterica subsp. enterica serovar Bredeney]
MKQQLRDYFRRGGTLRGAPTTAMEWELLYNQLRYQREVVRVMRKIHGVKFQFDHDYPINPDEKDPNAIRAEDGTLFIGRHVANNLRIEPASRNADKGNSIKPGYYSAAQITPLVVDEFVTSDGKRMNAGEMLELYEQTYPFKKSGYFTAEELEERRKRREERKEQGLSSIEWQYVPSYIEKVYSKPDWTMLKARLEVMEKQHKQYGDLLRNEGLRVSIALEIVQQVEQAIDIDGLKVKYSGDIEKALDYCWLVVSTRLDNADIEPLYLPTVDALINKQCWYGVEIANDGTACRVHYNAEEEPLLSEAFDLNDEIDKADEYYYRFKKPLPRRKYDAMWLSLIQANVEWELLKDEWDIAGMVFWMMGKLLKKDTLENMKEQNEQFAKRSIAETLQMIEETDKNDWKKLTNNAEKYVSVLGYPTSEYRAWLQGWYADELDKIEGVQTLPANNKRHYLVTQLNNEVLNNIPFIGL